ncbi:MAG: hypothetical protein GY815_10420 [Gammaproteobacteria bacterium]|nr:hypothetical protein [Gammaproteobacteria bacterium]
MTNPVSATIDFEHNGLLESCVEPGDPVRKGDFIAHIYTTERTGSDPVEYLAASDGIILGGHYSPLIKIGDFMNVIARITQELLQLLGTRNEI